MADNKFTLTPMGHRMLQRVQHAQSEQASLNSGTESGSTQFSDNQMGDFFARQRADRQAEVNRLSSGFVTTSGAVQPGPVMRGALGLMRSRFDIQGGNEESRDHVEMALSGATQSMAHNQVVAGVGMDLFGRMMRNVGRITQQNAAREAFNSGTPPSMQLSLRSDPSRAPDAENARLTVNINAGTAPHFNPQENSISLMTPSILDQTSHELQHARDHLHGDLNLNEPTHRLASELNAFTRQDEVAQQTTGLPPTTFAGRNPTQMAQSYHGKNNYPGTLTKSIAAVRQFKDG
ncbi:hypothetical protein ACVBE9_07190 [Eionea flava]